MFNSIYSNVRLAITNSYMLDRGLVAEVDFSTFPPKVCRAQRDYTWAGDVYHVEQQRGETYPNYTARAAVEACAALNVCVTDRPLSLTPHEIASSRGFVGYADITEMFNRAYGSADFHKLKKAYEEFEK